MTTIHQMIADNMQREGVEPGAMRLALDNLVAIVAAEPVEGVPDFAAGTIRTWFGNALDHAIRPYHLRSERADERDLDRDRELLESLARVAPDMTTMAARCGAVGADVLGVITNPPRCPEHPRAEVRDDTCTACDVWLDLCDACGQHGYHRDDCSEAE